MRHLYPIALSVLFSAAPLAQSESFPGVEKLMTAQEYRAAGLDKLTADERASLNQWLINYTVSEAPTMRQNNEEVRTAEESIRIEARLQGEFDGWTGDTLFYLDNGQVWKQRLDGRYPYRGASREVVIEKNLFGFYKMTVSETGKSIGVSRVK